MGTIEERNVGIKRRRRIGLVITAVVVVVVAVWCIRHYVFATKPMLVRDYAQIRQSGELNVVVSAGCTDCFVVDGEPLGFQLELLTAFARDNGLALNVIIENNRRKAQQLLNQHKCDIVASNDLYAGANALNIKHLPTGQKSFWVVVQRKQTRNDSAVFLQSSADLRHKTLHITTDIAAADLLSDLPSHIADSINIVCHNDVDIEHIVANVAHGTFDYTICDFHSAQTLRRFFRNIDLHLAISCYHHATWDIVPENKVLADSIETWINRFAKSLKFNTLCQKYLQKNSCIPYWSYDYYSGNVGRISPYDPLFKRYASIAGCDWRLLAALAYEESRFDEHAISKAGAQGLMQIMPETFQHLTDTSLDSTAANVFVAAKYLRMLSNQLPKQITDSLTRTKCVLAAYNIGMAHVEDALQLTIKYHKNLNAWCDVAFYLNRLNNADFYTDSVVKSGSFSGQLGVDFANSIVSRYRLYRQLIKP